MAMVSSRTACLLPALAAGLFLSTACASLPAVPPLPCRRIPIGPGPEDAVFDRAHGRLLVGSHDRRARTPPGEIYAVDLTSGEAQVIERRGDPATLVLRPHGLDLVTRDNGDLELLVVTHGSATAEEDWHAVVRYRVEVEHLQFVAVHHHPMMVAPNDVAGLADGGFYASNTASSHNNVLETMLGLKTGSLLYFDGKGVWRRVATDLAYPNGVIVLGEELWVSTTREHLIYAFRRMPDGSLRRREPLVEIPGGDNFSRDGGDVLVTSHPSSLAFVRHASDGAVLSPSVVYRIKLNSETARAIYADSGEQISAASTALMAGGVLYLVQVFEPFILACKP